MRRLTCRDAFGAVALRMSQSMPLAQSIPLPLSMSRGSPALSIIVAVLSLLLGAPRLAAQPALSPPLSPACISSSFGARGPGGARASRLHTGMDIPAPPGAWVRAAAAGRITSVRRRGAAGLEVTVAHAGGLTTRYAHLGTAAPAIASGRREVAQGEALGRVGRTGITYGTHLHFEVLVSGALVDPATLLPLPACAR